MKQFRSSKVYSLRRHQSGAVLVVALIILTALTLVGVSSMQSTTLEMRMVNSSVERNRSFAAVEAAISHAINELEENVDSLDDLHSDSPSSLFTRQCDGSGPDGEGGWCFLGEYTVDMTKTYECRHMTEGSVENPVLDPSVTSGLNVWNDGSSRHVSFAVDGVSIKYIIQFKCFVGTVANYGPYLGGSDEADPFFVITAYMESSSGRPPVMIQVSHTVRI